jgi:hypothetical protein
LGRSRTLADLERGRASYAKSAWADAYASLARADEAAALSADDLVLLATSAYMLGREDEWMTIFERAYHRSTADGDELRAARYAFWIGMHLALRGEMGPATGWLGRAQRLVDRAEGECVEHGYLLMPVAFQHEAAGDLEGAAATAASAAEIAERFGDADLFALAVHEQGNILVRDGRLTEGLPLLDEAMVAATSGELSPVVTGIVYCGVILACEEVYELRRAQEWTAALTRWCRRQPDLMAFTGRCLVHRARLMQLHGAWRDALEEARRAGVRFKVAANQAAAAAACYVEGEVHRLRGEFAAAEQAYSPSEPAAGLRGDHADGRRRCRGSRALRRARGDRRRLRNRHAPRDGFVCARCGRAGGRRRDPCPRDAPAGVPGVADARGAVRDGANANAGRAGVPGSRRRRRICARARRGP